MKHIFLLCLLANQLLAARSNVFDSSKSLHFVLEDYLAHPFYWWPRTLLSYPVRFEGVTVMPGDLTLTDGHGNAQPMQLSEVKVDQGHLVSATVNFFADLPSGARRDFVLSVEKRAETTRPQVTERQEVNTIVLDSGVMRVRLPASQLIGDGPVPGPILQVSRGTVWMGNSKIVTPVHKVLRIKTTRLESGSLFITYRVAYDLDGGGSYIAVIRCLGGMDFVEFHEEMNGIAAEDKVFLEMSWTGFHPTHRQSPNNPYVPGQSDRLQKRYEDYPWERIDDPQLNTHLGVVPGISADGEMAFRLGIFQPWPAFLVGTSANFWDEHSNDALGLFIDKIADWQDHDYAIWHASTKIEIRYAYRQGVLSWKWPLATGRRSTCIAAYDHAKDISAMHDMEETHAGKKGSDGFIYRSSLYPTSYMLFLQNRHGTLDLNMVKDWVLEYPERARRPPVLFHEGRVQTIADLERMVLGSALTNEAAASGTRQNGGFGPTQSRQVGDWWIDAYNRLYPQMTAQQRRHIDAAFLLTAYIHAGEDYMPMVPMLSGHPNFLSDVKSVPAMISFLFPDHPDAATWADEFRKYVELNTHYHTRPEVSVWDSHAGRWTESLSTYVWGFFRPALRAAYTLQQFDGGNRFVTPELAEVGNWLVDALSAPFDGDSDRDSGALAVHQWGFVRKQNGPRRIYPPIGAHSTRRQPPRSLWFFGTLLQRFDPLTAEHLMWAARPNDQDVETSLTAPDPWRVMYQQPDNRGTNPHLKSRKYTGYGVVLRSGVDTPHEVSLHLQQVDEGPNYRWGVAGEDGNGVIYYYADGKAFSHNGTEDFGDRAEQDTDFCSTFGVFKNGKFRSIGPNVLERPFYDFDAAQFAELVSKNGRGAYSWPEYKSRSTLLVGTDYFIVYDALFNQAVPHRFSWFNKQGDDFPFIQIVKGGSPFHTELSTGSTHGVWYDGFGDSMAVVSQRKDLVVTPEPYGAQVKVNGNVDTVFDDQKDIRYEENGIAFKGTSGVIRRQANGRYMLALFHGTHIGAGNVSIHVSGTDVGLSAAFQKAGKLQGQYFVPVSGTIHIQSAALSASSRFYIDGAEWNGQRDGDSLTVMLAPGRHHWQVTEGLPVPLAPAIEHTENTANGATIFLSPVSGATEYRIEVSRDSGATWSVAGTTRKPEYTLTGLQNGIKIHVRAIAANAAYTSEPGPEYPVYVTDRPPLPPDGLRVTLTPQKPKVVQLTWGAELGIKQYHLYRRQVAQKQFKMIYSGSGREFADRSIDGTGVYEYAVSALNGNGEGPVSHAVTTDSSSWTNFDPKPGEPFRRVSYAGIPSEDETSIPTYYPK